MNERDFPVPRCPLDCGVRPQGGLKSVHHFVRRSGCLCETLLGVIHRMPTAPVALWA